MPKNPNTKIFARLKKLHPGLLMVYLNPDGRRVAIYRHSKWKRVGKKSLRMKLTHDHRWTVYGKNGKVTHASTEGFRSLKHCLQNASAPTALPPVPELGGGIMIKASEL